PSTTLPLQVVQAPFRQLYGSTMPAANAASSTDCPSSTVNSCRLGSTVTLKLISLKDPVKDSCPHFMPNDAAASVDALSVTAPCPCVHACRCNPQAPPSRARRRFPCCGRRRERPSLAVRWPPIVPASRRHPVPSVAYPAPRSWSR